MQFLKANQDKERKKQRLNNQGIRDNSPEYESGEILNTDTNGKREITPLAESQEQIVEPMERGGSSYVDPRQTSTGELIADQPLPSLVVNIPRNGEEQYERSPKTINLGSSGEEPDYNVRTLNARKSPPNIENPMYRDSGEPGPEGYYDDDFQGYGEGTGDSQQRVPPPNMYSRSRSPQVYERNKDVSPYGNKTFAGRRKMSPNNFYEDSNSSIERGQEQRPYNEGYMRDTGDMRRTNPMHSRADTNPQGEEVFDKYNDKTYNMSYKDVKKIAGRFAKIYDPNKNSNGILLGDSQVTVPGAYDDVFDNRFRVLSKMNRLSNILLAKQRKSPKKYEEENSNRDNNSYNENSKKTFNRKTMKDSVDKKGKHYSRSPDHKFLYVSLAMLSSRGPTCEDRTILRRMRLEKGGVVDLAQEDNKKNRFRIKKASPKKGGTRGFSYANPKYRDKAAKVIQDWWRDLKDLYNDRLNKIIKIQSVWRGKFVRKYMYDLFYLNFLYISFCKKIENVLSNHVRPYVFNKLKNRDDDEKDDALKKIIKKDYRNNRKFLYPAWKKWVDQIRRYNYKNKRGRNLIQIRAEKENKLNDLRSAFDRWRYVTKMLKTLEENEDNKRRAKDLVDKEKDMNKIKGLFKILDGVDKLTKKEAMDQVVPKLVDYLNDQKEKGKLKKIVDKKPNRDADLLRKFLFKWYTNTLGKNEDDDNDRYDEFRGRVFLSKIDSFEKKRDKNLLRKYFNKYFRTSVLIAIEEEREKALKRDKDRRDKENDLIKEYEIKLANLQKTGKDEEDFRKRIDYELTKLKIVKEEEEKTLRNKYAEDNDLLSKLEACKILQRAVWRITHRDPLEAFEDKIIPEETEKLLLKLIQIKKEKLDDKLRRAFDIWRDKTFKYNKDFINKLLAKLLFITANDHKRKLLAKKFNLWRYNIRDKKHPYDSLKKAKDFYDFLELIRKIYVNQYGDEFLDRLDRTRNPYLLKVLLRRIILSLNKKRPDSLRNAFYKWRDITQNKSIYELLLKLLYRTYEIKESKDRQLLDKYFQKWKKATEDDDYENIRIDITTIEVETIETRNKYIKNLIDNIYKKQVEDLLRKFFNRWRKTVRKLRDLDKQKDFDDSKIAILLEKFIKKQKQLDYLTLLQYLLRWKQKVYEIRQKELPKPYRRQMIQIFMTKNDKEILRKYFDRWRFGHLRKMPIMPYIVAKRILRRVLIRRPFYRFINKMIETNPRLLREKGNKLMNLIKLILRRRFKEFLNKLRTLIFIKKFREIQPKVNSILTKYYLAKYFFRWADNVLGEKERRRNAYAEWVKKMQREYRLQGERRRKEILTIIITKLTQEEDMLKMYTLLKWLKNAELDRRLENAKIIQEFCRRGLKDILLRDVAAQKKFSKILMKLYRRIYIRKVRDFARQNIRKLIDYLNLIKTKKTLLISIITISKNKRNRDLLEYYFYKWRKFLDFCNDKAILLQKVIRMLFAKRKRDALKRLLEQLYFYCMKKERNINNLLLYMLHKWRNNARRVECIDNSKIIQEFCRTNLYERLKDKYWKFINRLINKYLFRLLKYIAKFNRLKDTLRRRRVKEAFDRINRYGRMTMIKKILIRILKNYEDQFKYLLLKYIFELWLKKVKRMKERDIERLTKLQAMFRGYRFRRDIILSEERLKRLLYLFYKADRNPNSLLRSALAKWRKKVGEIKCDENARIIQEFCRSIYAGILRNKKLKIKEYYRILCEKIILIKVSPYDFFERLKLIRRNQILKEFVDLLNKKRLDHLRYLLLILRKNPKTKYLVKIMHIPGDFFKRILKKYFDIWRDKANRNKRITIVLGSILLLMINKQEDRLKATLQKWMYHARFRTQTENANIIIEFCRGILAGADASKNWRLLAYKLLRKRWDQSVLDIIRKLKILFGLDKLKRPLVRHVRKEIMDLLRRCLFFKLFMLKIKIKCQSIDDNANKALLKKYFNIWKYKALLLKKRESGMKDIVDIFEKLRRKKATPYIEYSSLIKLLFILIPRIQAICYLRKLRIFANSRKRNNLLAEDLIRANEEIKPRNKNNLVKKLIKVYAYKVLDKFMDRLEKIRERKNLLILREFLRLLYENFIKNSECSYIGKKENESNPNNQRTTFRLKKKVIPEGDNYKKLTYVTLLPHLVRYIIRLILRRKRYALEEIEDASIADRFCKLYKSWTTKKIKPPKKELVDKLKITAEMILSEGPLKIKLFKLLRKYAIYKILINCGKIRRFHEIQYLIKLVYLSKKVTRQRFLRQLIRKWKYITFARILAENKMKKLYKNLHSSYLEISNCLFGEESKGNRNVIKEFERLGTDIGIWENEEPDEKEEVKYVKTVKTKYTFDSADFDKYVSAYYPETIKKKEYVKVETTSYAPESKRGYYPSSRSKK